MPSAIVLFNPMPVKHSVAVVNKMTTSLQVPLVNIPLLLPGISKDGSDDGEWGDFDQFDFKAPWMPQELYDLVLELRAGMPWNSGCGFHEWCQVYLRVMEKLEGMG